MLHTGDGEEAEGAEGRTAAATGKVSGLLGSPSSFAIVAELEAVFPMPVFSSMAFSVSCDISFFSFSGLRSVLIGLILPGEGGRG